MTEHTRALLQLILESKTLDELRASAALPEPDGDTGYYFVSYSHLDYKTVLHDILLLTEAGLGIWYDRGLESGKSWISEVSKKISSYSCRGVLFYITEAFLASPSCLRELSHFLTDGGDRGALFLCEDSLRHGLQERLRAALCAAGGAEASRALSAIRILPRSATLARKLAAIRRLAAPSLLRYRAVPLLPHLPYRFATVTDLCDRNARTVTVPPTCKIGGRRFRVLGIAEGAFHSCEMLEEVRMGRFHTVDSSAFSRCPSLRRVTLGAPARFFGFPIGVIGRALEQCPEATLAHRGRGILYFGSFRRRTDLTEFSPPKGHRIAGDAFLGCPSLTSVTLGRRDLLDGRTFENCTALETLSLPHGNITRKMEHTFSGCVSLRKVTLPSSLRVLGEGVFRECHALREITLPKHLSEIDPRAFSGCTSLLCVTVDCRDCRFLENTPYSRRTALDVLFPLAERFYLRHLPAVPAFDSPVREVASDRAGYRLFVREEASHG